MRFTIVNNVFTLTMLTVQSKMWMKNRDTRIPTGHSGVGPEALTKAFVVAVQPSKYRVE